MNVKNIRQFIIQINTALLLILLSHICNAYQEIKIFKYIHFFSKFDLPYEKTKKGWNVQVHVNKDGFLDDMNWSELSNEQDHYIGSYYLCDSLLGEKTIRTEPLLIQFDKHTYTI